MDRKEYQRTKMRMLVYPTEDIISTSAATVSDDGVNDVYDDGWTPSGDNMRS